MKRLFLKIFTSSLTSSKEEEIIKYETDTEQILVDRIQFKVNPNFPTSVIVNGKSAVDIESFLSTIRLEQLTSLYEEMNKNGFRISFFEYLSHFFLFQLLRFPFDIHSQKWSTQLLSLKVMFVPDLTKSFPPLLDPVTQKKMHIREYLAKIDAEWFKKHLQEKKDNAQIYSKKVKESEEIGSFFEKVDPIPVYDQEQIGQIISFDVKTSMDTTGTIFSKLELNEHVPVAKYKTFFNYFHSCPSQIQLDEQMDIDFYALRVFNEKGIIQIVVLNKPYGLMVQAIVTKDSIFVNKDSVLAFLKLENGEKEVANGVLFNCKIENPCPEGFKQDMWTTPIDPSIFSNMCINNRLFSRFLTVNDTDKISRQNSSVYLYFKSPTFHMKESEPVYVGGWNRSSSRFGDLTAILTPERRTIEDSTIQISIKRSIHKEVVDQFILFISKLIRIYNLGIKDEIQQMRKLLPKFHLADIPIQLITKVGMSLSDQDPKIFPKNVYSVACQKGKPVIISEEEASKYPENQTIRFPPVAVEDFQPKIYSCHENDVYKYIGFVDMKKKVPDHPFGIAPCCFKKDNTQKNEIEMAKITTMTETEDVPIIYMPSSYRLTTEKIIDQAGHLGVLPIELRRFFLMLHPLREYWRIGMPYSWRNKSVLACCEYYYGVTHKETHFRNLNRLLQSMESFGLACCYQQTYDMNQSDIARNLLNVEDYMDPRIYLPLLEGFYGVTIIIFCKHTDGTFTILRPNVYHNLVYTIDPSKPVLFVYQHFGGAKNVAKAIQKQLDPVHELIGWQKDQVLNLSSELDASMMNMIQIVNQSFSGNKENVPVMISGLHILLRHLFYQYIDPVGKVRVLFLGANKDVVFPFFLKNSLPPFNHPLKSVESIPRFDPDILVYLKEKLHLEPIREEQVIMQTRIFYFDHPIEMMLVLKDEKIDSAQPIPLYLWTMLPKKSVIDSYTDLAIEQQKVNILQDVLLIYLARFVKQFKKEVMSKSESEIINLFLENKVTFGSSKELITKIVPNVDRIMVSTRLKKRLIYFLTWFLTTKPKDLEAMTELREIPSYYQDTIFFQKQKNQYIYSRPQPIADMNHYPFLTGRLQQELSSMQYYFDPLYTPLPIPYIVLSVSDMDDATDRVYFFETQKGIEKEIGLEIIEDKSGISYYVRSENGLWKSVGMDAQCAIEEIDSLWYLYIPISTISI